MNRKKLQGVVELAATIENLRALEERIEPGRDSDTLLLTICLDEFRNGMCNLDNETFKAVRLAVVEVLKTERFTLTDELLALAKSLDENPGDS